MAAALTCPKPRELQDLLLGQLDEKTAEELEAHVQTCSLCGTSLRTLAAEDDLVVAMRGCSAVVIPAGEDERIAELSNRLEKQGPGGGLSDTTMSEKTCGDVKLSDFRTEKFRPLDMCPSLSERFLALNG